MRPAYARISATEQMEIVSPTSKVVIPSYIVKNLDCQDEKLAVRRD